MAVTHVSIPSMGRTLWGTIRPIVMRGNGVRSATYTPRMVTVAGRCSFLWKEPGHTTITARSVEPVANHVLCHVWYCVAFQVLGLPAYGHISR